MDNDGGDCPFYQKLRNRPITPLSPVADSKSARSEVSATHRIQRKTARSARRGLDCGDVPIQEEEDDGSITIHSLSSNARIVVPETPRSVPPELDRVLKNAVVCGRPRSAGRSAKSTRPDNRQIQTAYGDNKTPRVLSPRLILASPSSSKTYVIRKHAKGEDWYMDHRNQTPSRLDSAQSRHQAVRPTASQISTCCQESLPPTGYSARIHNGSSQVVHRGYTKEQDELVEQMRQLFQINGTSEPYKEWRLEEKNDSDKSSQSNAVFELVENLYEKLTKEIPEEPRMYYEYRVLLGNIVDLLDEFAYLPVPPGFLLKCRVTRVKKGVDGTIFPQYFMHLERPNSHDTFLMGAQKYKSMSAAYVISTDPSSMSISSYRTIGVLKSNLRGCKFNLLTSGVMDPEKDSSEDEDDASHNKRASDKSLLHLAYEPNHLGFSGPRQLKVIIPKMKSDYERVPVTAKLLKMPEQELISLRNKQPSWNDETHSFVMNFRGRVAKASVKNFQITHPDCRQALLQFGRVDKNDFILDFTYPFSPLQAFAVGLSSFDSKWGIE